MSFTYFTATQARTIYSELVNEAAYGGKRVVLTRHGKNIVAIVPIADLEMILELQEILDVTSLSALKRQLGLPSQSLKKAADRDQFVAHLMPIITEIQNSGATTATAIAAELNKRNVPARRGGRWTHVQVMAVLGQARQT